MRSWIVNRHDSRLTSLADAELAEYRVEHVLAGHRAGDLADVVERRLDVDGDDVGRQSLTRRVKRLSETDVDLAEAVVLAGAARHREPLARGRAALRHDGAA